MPLRRPHPPEGFPPAGHDLAATRRRADPRQRLANAVCRLSGLPHRVTGNGLCLAWTPYRYPVCLHWMTQTARAAGVEPELLELTLFQPPGDPGEEDDAAD